MLSTELLQRVRALDFHCDFEVRRLNSGNVADRRTPGRERRCWRISIWPRIAGEAVAVCGEGSEIEAALRAAVEKAELNGWAEQDYQPARESHRAFPFEAVACRPPWVPRMAGAAFGLFSVCGGAGAAQLDVLVGATVGVSEMLLLGSVLYLVEAPILAWMAVAMAALLLQGALVVLIRRRRRMSPSDQ